MAKVQTSLLKEKYSTGSEKISEYQSFSLKLISTDHFCAMQELTYHINVIQRLSSLEVESEDVSELFISTLERQLIVECHSQHVKCPLSVGRAS